jgi:hydrogenase small subunit
MGLSQTDLLKVKEALAAWPGPGPEPDPNMPIGTLARVIWITGADCGGCATTLLNFIGNPNDTDPVLAAIANKSIPLAAGGSYPLVDIEALYPQGADKNIDIAEVVLEIVTIDWGYIVMAASGDVPNNWMKQLRNDGGYVLMFEGAIQTAASGKYCRVFSIPGDLRGGIWDSYVEYDAVLGKTEFTMAGATLWLAQNADAVVCLGTCASYGGIPACTGSVTGAKSGWEWINDINELDKVIANVPGCPPHPDWFVHTVGAYLLDVVAGWGLGTFLKLNTDLDHKGRPKLTSTAIYHENADYFFCQDCPRVDEEVATKLCKAKRSAAHPKGLCMKDVGCVGHRNGPAYNRADCPTRKWNIIEKYTPNLVLKKNNWCVGNNYPCQGCTDPGFPDTNSPFFSKDKNS